MPYRASFALRCLSKLPAAEQNRSLQRCILADSSKPVSVFSKLPENLAQLSDTLPDDKLEKARQTLKNAEGSCLEFPKPQCYANPEKHHRVVTRSPGSSSDFKYSSELWAPRCQCASESPAYSFFAQKLEHMFVFFASLILHLSKYFLVTWAFRSNILPLRTSNSKLPIPFFKSQEICRVRQCHYHRFLWLFKHHSCSLYVCRRRIIQRCPEETSEDATRCIIRTSYRPDRLSYLLHNSCPDATEVE